MPRLSSNLEDIQAHYTVVVIGSGYGGAILASRLARAGQRVCVLERGKEFLPGQFPTTEGGIRGESQFNAPCGLLSEGRLGPATGLFDYHLNPRMNALVGCGLGGTSLINANVAIRPDPRVFADPRWPAALREDVDTLLAEGYRRASDMLRPTTYPVDEPARFPIPNRLAAMREAGAAIGARVHLMPISVSFRDGVNHVGVEQAACNLCGDCVSGCNHGAKNTLAMNYLPDAKRHGAEIYTRIKARRISRGDGAWRVHFRVVDDEREKFGDVELFVGADVVILAAGALGTTEILLRSRAAGLPLSGEIGRHFSANRNVLGFGFNGRAPIDGIGSGDRPIDPARPVGPTITASIDMRDRPDVNEGTVIEDGVVPGGVAAPFLKAILASAALLGERPAESAAEAIEALGRDVESVFEGPYRGALERTLTMLGVGHDGSPGELYLEDDRIRLAWPEGLEASAAELHAQMERAVFPLGSTFVRNPIWSDLTDHAMLTVHPLGGCVLAEDASSGGVNHKGQLFSGPSGASAHEGLYALDGSILPRSLGLNPLLTISALAERAAVLLARDRGWSFSYDLPAAAPPLPPPRRLGLVFTEALRGAFSARAGGDFERGEELGEEEGSSLSMILSVATRDLDRTLADPAHPLRFMGSAEAPALSSAPLLVTNGTLALFIADPTDDHGKRLVYTCAMTSAEGRAYYMQGTKIIRHHFLTGIWSNMTTLFTTIHDGPTPASPILGQGIIHVHPTDLLRQLTTLAVVGEATEEERARALLAFGEFFGLTLLEAHADFWGGIRQVLGG